MKAIAWLIVCAALLTGCVVTHRANGSVGVTPLWKL
jgi:predicted small secreted protein